MSRARVRPRRTRARNELLAGLCQAEPARASPANLLEHRRELLSRSRRARAAFSHPPIRCAWVRDVAPGSLRTRSDFRSVALALPATRRSYEILRFSSLT